MFSGLDVLTTDVLDEFCGAIGQLDSDDVSNSLETVNSIFFHGNMQSFIFWFLPAINLCVQAKNIFLEAKTILPCCMEVRGHGPPEEF